MHSKLPAVLHSECVSKPCSNVGYFIAVKCMYYIYLHLRISIMGYACQETFILV